MPMAPVAGAGNLNPTEFKHKIIANVESVIGRINEIAPQCVSEEVYICQFFCPPFRRIRPNLTIKCFNNYIKIKIFKNYFSSNINV